MGRALTLYTADPDSVLSTSYGPWSLPCVIPGEWWDWMRLQSLIAREPPTVWFLSKSWDPTQHLKNTHVRTFRIRAKPESFINTNLRGKRKIIITFQITSAWCKLIFFLRETVEVVRGVINQPKETVPYKTLLISPWSTPFLYLLITHEWLSFLIITS